MSFPSATSARDVLCGCSICGEQPRLQGITRQAIPNQRKISKIMQNTLTTDSLVWTLRPAPYLPGLYCMQALSSDAGIPNIAQYHRTPEAAVEWMAHLADKKLFDAYALRLLGYDHDIYTNNGKAAGRQFSITFNGLYWEGYDTEEVDYDAYVASAKEILGPEVTCITRADHRLNASSVSHSNMAVVARQMITGAFDKDLEHIYHVDSIASGCRVEGWFMDVSKVSERLRNQYLDRYKWLSKGWPLDKAHHMQKLAYHMITLQPDQILEILKFVNQRVKLGEYMSRVSRRIWRGGLEKRIMFASKMFEGMEAAVVVGSPQEPESFDYDVVAQHANRIAALYRETFLHNITAP